MLGIALLATLFVPAGYLFLCYLYDSVRHSRRHNYRVEYENGSSFERQYTGWFDSIINKPGTIVHTYDCPIRKETDEEYAERLKTLWDDEFEDLKGIIPDETWDEEDVSALM